MISEYADAKKQGILEKMLEKLYYDDNDRAVTLREMIEGINILYKKTTTRNVSARRIHLEYKEIKPKTTYSLWYQDAACREVGLDIPKCVYDALNVREINK